MKALLPDFLKFKTAKDLIRIGRDNDGGYLISKKDIKYSDILISLGINSDWSYEEDFLKYKKVPILAFDGTINSKKFFKDIVKTIFRFDNPKLFINAVKTYISYLRFFRNSIRHFQINVSSQTKEISKYITLEEVFAFTDKNNVFLKIDIEGFEYRILDSILENQNRLSGLAIEFHDFDLHLDKIESFIKQLSLHLVHIHANNWGIILEKNQLPEGLEMTFSSNAEQEEKSILPHPLDMPNNPSKEEIILSFDL